jgi:hypothetical protein
MEIITLQGDALICKATLKWLKDCCHEMGQKYIFLFMTIIEMGKQCALEFDEETAWKLGQCVLVHYLAI